MSPKSKREYLNAIAPRYRNGPKEQKTIILNEFCNVYNCQRKHAIRLLNSYKRFQKPRLKRRGRLPKYKNNKELTTVLQNIWIASNLPYSKMLKTVIPLWLPYYHKEYGYIALGTVKLLNSISPATIDRVLQSVRIKLKKRGRSTTKLGTLLKKHISIKTNQWNESKPCFLEADTVGHCGDSIAGDYIYTLDTVNIATGWTEQRATWGS